MVYESASFDRFHTYHIRVLCVQRRTVTDKMTRIVRLKVEGKYEISYVIFNEG
jgi:hypothetical protein